MFGDDFFGIDFFALDYFGDGGSSPPSPGGSSWTFFTITPLEVIDYRSLTIPSGG
jgi:hypothetical protein